VLVGGRGKGLQIFYGGKGEEELGKEEQLFGCTHRHFEDKEGGCPERGKTPKKK